jgi:hypothetical protein
MRLTDTQLVLLSAASQREDCGIELAPNLKGGVAHKVVGKLLTEGLVEEIPARGALPVWRRDDEEGALALRITQRGALRPSRSTRAGRCRTLRKTRLRNALPHPAGGIRSRPG